MGQSEVKSPGRQGLAEGLTKGPSFLPSPLPLYLSLSPHSQQER